MGWNDEEVQNTKKGMSLSSKVLLGIIFFVILIIILLIMLLMGAQETSLKVYVDGTDVSNVIGETFLTTIEDVTYVSIEDFSKLVGYEYHRGEYKSSIIEEDKCYVEGELETASFYLNHKTIYKLLVNERSKEYEEYTVENTIKSINDRIYASTEAIAKAFNVLISEENGNFEIYTLDYIINIYNTKVQKWGYTDITQQSFENQKAILQGFLIVKKEGGLYKIIDTENTKEIVLDRYKSIQFSENTQEFFATDSSDKVGIINIDGTTKIQPTYQSISILNKKLDLYIVQQDKKYGVVSGDSTTVIYPEYDNIGLANNNFTDNKYLILDKLIPVLKDKKWGAFNKYGELVLNVEYDEFGYSLTNIEIDGVKEVVEPVLSIGRANGIVVKKDNKYGLLGADGKELVPIAVEGIYAISGVEDEDSKYYMLYKGKKLNVIQRLISAGLIEEKNDDKDEEIENNVNNNTTNETNIQNTTNTVTNTIENNTEV